jgi:hypothetical protein
VLNRRAWLVGELPLLLGPTVRRPILQRVMTLSSGIPLQVTGHTVILDGNTLHTVKTRLMLHGHVQRVPERELQTVGTGLL